MTGPVVHDEEALATEEVHCVGQVIAAVCATSRAAARAAARAVLVEYRELPAVVGLEEAVAAGSFFPLLFQDKVPDRQEAQIHGVEEPAYQEGGIDALFDALVGSAGYL